MADKRCPAGRDRKSERPAVWQGAPPVHKAPNLGHYVQSLHQTLEMLKSVNNGMKARASEMISREGLISNSLSIWSCVKANLIRCTQNTRNKIYTWHTKHKHKTYRSLVYYSDNRETGVRWHNFTIFTTFIYKAATALSHRITINKLVLMSFIK